MAANSSRNLAVRNCVILSSSYILLHGSDYQDGPRRSIGEPTLKRGPKACRPFLIVEPGQSLVTVVGFPSSPIAQAARKLFAENGYERTTIRAVASKANIDPTMVMRYFGSKDGLFAAVASIDLRLPDLTAVPRDELGEWLVRHILEHWESAEEDSLVVLLRAAASNEGARVRMREVLRS